MRREIEPFGLAPDTPFLSDGYASWRRQDAVRGSRRLRKAIDRLQTQVRKRTGEFRPRTWAARLEARRKTRIIQNLAAGYFGITITELLGPDRKPQISRQRHIAMYVSRLATTASYPDIALCFNRQDHTTIIYACDKIAGDAEANEDVRLLSALVGTV